MKTTVVLVIDHKKPIANLADIAAGRVYTLDGVDDVVPSDETSINSFELSPYNATQTIDNFGNEVRDGRTIFKGPSFWERLWA